MTPAVPDQSFPNPLPDIDKLWNYGNPKETERKFREILPQAELAGKEEYLAELLTQVARAEGLQGKFDEAHSLLDRVERMVVNDWIHMARARIRYNLERGRAFNSSGQSDKSAALFQIAYEQATRADEVRLAIDAIHMLAIVAKDPQKQIELNLEGIELTRANPDQQGWLHALYNNIAESYAVIGDYSSAYQYFHQLAELQASKGQPDIYTLKDVAKMLRLMGRPQESLAIMEPIASDLEMKGKHDGWLEEEIAESLLAVDRPADAKPHFVEAHKLLSKDNYCLQHEQVKLKRLKQMAE